MTGRTATLEITRDSRGELVACLSGEWIMGASIPDSDLLLAGLDGEPSARSLRFDCTRLQAWDSLALCFLVKLEARCTALGIIPDRSGLPDGIQGMLTLAGTVPDQPGSHPVSHTSLPERMGQSLRNGLADTLAFAEFIGEVAFAFSRMLKGKARFRRQDLWQLVHDCGPNALPIISLISILVGMILAFVGAIQLKLFGAQIFIADLVGLGMAREMGAMMTAILMAGRTGAAFAAELGSMTVNDEIDALKTSGFSPVEFMVLPRIIALFAMTPLLCLYADILGILGGAFVAAGLFDISFPEYLLQIQNRLRLIDFEVGIAKSAVFGILVALAGCLRGLQTRRSATAVGLAATSAVVTGIVLIVVSDAVMTLVATALNVFKR